MAEKQVEILLVEDNPDDVELALHALKRHKLANTMHVAGDGVEALEYIFGSVDGGDGDTLHHHPRLVLLDLKLPRIDGLEVLERLKGDARSKRIPVVVLTSSNQEPDLERAYELGANSYIVKPVDFEQFVDAVRQLGFYWLLLNQAPSL